MQRAVAIDDAAKIGVRANPGRTCALSTTQRSSYARLSNHQASPAKRFVVARFERQRHVTGAAEIARDLLLLDHLLDVVDGVQCPPPECPPHLIAVALETLSISSFSPSSPCRRCGCFCAPADGLLLRAPPRSRLALRSAMAALSPVAAADHATSTRSGRSLTGDPLGAAFLGPKWRRLHKAPIHAGRLSLGCRDCTRFPVAPKPQRQELRDHANGPLPDDFDSGP